MVEENRLEIRLEDLRVMAIPGYAFEAVCDSADEDSVLMGLQQAHFEHLSPDVYEVFLRTTRGDIRAVLTVSQGKPGVVLYVPGGENLNGPAGGIYADLAGELQAAGVSSLRMAYRDQDSYQECVLDALAWLCFLKGTGAKEVVVVGNSLGAAVAIPTAVLHPLVKAIVVISPRQGDTEMTDRVAPKPLLIIHGGQDPRVSVEVAQELHRRAGDPKELVIYPDGGPTLVECRDELHQKLGMWLAEQLGAVDTYLEALGARGARYRDLAKSVPLQGSSPARQMVLTRDDLVDMDVDAIVSTTGTWLDLPHTPLAAAIVERGGWEIQEQLWALAPLFVGDVAVTGAGQLKARHVFHAITGGDSAEAPLTREQAVAVTTLGSLKEADKMGLKTIALPAIGTGGRGFPLEKAAQIMVGVVAAYLAGETSLEKVIFAVVTDGAYRAFESQFNLLPD